MNKVILITSRNLNKGGTGEYFKIIAFLKAFRELGYDVEILNTSFSKPKTCVFYGAKILYEKPKVINAVVNFIKYFPTSMQRAIFSSSINASNFQNYDAALFSLIRTVPYEMTDFPPKVYVDFADLLSVNFRRLGDKIGGMIGVIRKIEAWLIRKDEIKIGRSYESFFVGKSETLLAKRWGLKSVQLMQPAPLSLNSFCGQVAVNRQKSVENRLLFVGPNSYFPNHEALLWLNNEIANKIRPNYEVHWVGFNNGKHDYKNIKSLGYVDDLVHEIKCSKFNIIPIFTATGIQNKLLDCLYLGASCITTARLARTVDAYRNACVYTASTKNEMQELILNLIKRDVANEECNSDGLHFNYGFEGFKEKLEIILNENIDN